jgi:uncharacterized protein
VITVHGSNADRRQFLRFVPVLHRAGLSILDITYRNDLGAPASPDGLMHLGLSEWRDLDAAVMLARSRGAQHIVLFGGSMGGAIVLQFLANSPNASHICAVLLDSPMLSIPSMMKYIGSEHYLPSPITSMALHLTNLRLRSDVRRIDALDFPPKEQPPTLVLQGKDDEIMPFACARAFVAAGARHGWRIEYAEFPGADHGGVWNSDADRAEMTVTDFLKRVGSGSATDAISSDRSVGAIH